jgi:hypothetical protein
LRLLSSTSTHLAKARAALLFFFADRYAELIEWAALQCDAAGEPLTKRQRAALLSAGAGCSVRVASTLI